MAIVIILYLIVTYLMGIGFFLDDLKNKVSGTWFALIFAPIFIPIKIGDKLKDSE